MNWIGHLLVSRDLSNMEESQLNDKQKVALEQFKDAIKDCKMVDQTETHLLKWLKARDFNVSRAEKMLRASLEWRRINRIDDLNEDWKPAEVVKKYFPVGFVGNDKLGCPLWIVAYGRADLRGILHSAKKKDYINYVVSLVETSLRRMREQSGNNAGSISQQTIVFDMDQFSMKHITYKPAMDTAIQLVQIYEANYPEMLRRVFVINAPRVFTIAYAMLKPFLHEVTVQKIRIFGSDDQQWKAAMLEEIDPAQLPVHYGGTMTDPDGNPMCLSKVCMGGEVPKSHYFSKKSKANTSYENTMTIANGSKRPIEYEVKKADSILRWEFETEEGDIAFGIFRKVADEMIEIVPSDRVDSHIAPEEGEIKCEHTGTYLVEFDNSFSYLRSKKVNYTIQVISS